MTGEKIFISHASADKSLAGLMQRAMIFGGVPPEKIFYSSSRLTGIPAGRDVQAYLRQSLREAGLVIELLTQTFLARPVCLMELGAAWVSETPTFPIVVPPLTVRQASEAIGNVHLIQLAVEGANEDMFSELHDRLGEDVELHLSARQWGLASKEFATGLTGVLMESSPPDQSAIPVGTHQSQIPSNDADEEFIFERVVVKNGKLYGEAMNRDSVQRTAILSVTFYDVNGEIIGSDQTAINDVRPGQSRTFTFTNVPVHAQRKIEVATLI